MATIKSYTDLEQSKKLAEILPLESADMYWKNGVSDKYIQCFTPFVTDDYRSNVDYDYDVPCWSLAALLELIRNFQPNNQSAFFIGKKDGYQYMSCVYLATQEHNNPVDACYEMILRLHEQNLL